MRDFLPVEKAKRDQVLDTILSTYQSHGFQAIETPALENIERLTSGQGGDNEKLAFRVLKRGEELASALATENVDNLSDLGLRYDLTVPLTRFYATNQTKLPKVLKAIQSGPVWRAERPQKGRYRQFIQCDIDIIGDETNLAEIEILNASLDALDAIGIKNATIRLNHRALLTASILSLGVGEKDSQKAMIIIDKLDKLGSQGVVKEMLENFGQAVADKTLNWLDEVSEQGSFPEELIDIASALSARHQGRLRFDKTLVRGMGYYTGAIFEIEHPDSGSSIGGGGRYDGMVGKWLGTEVPAVGISFGFERVMELVEAKKDLVKSLVLVFEANQMARALDIQAEAIAKGYRVRLQQTPKKLNVVLESLEEQGFESFAVLDDSILSFDQLSIKKLA
jgi:histidyl-tRNA synthetase